VAAKQYAFYLDSMTVAFGQTFECAVKLTLSLRKDVRAVDEEALYRHYRAMTNTYDAVFSHHPSVGKLYTLKK